MRVRVLQVDVRNAELASEAALLSAKLVAREATHREESLQFEHTAALNEQLQLENSQLQGELESLQARLAQYAQVVIDQSESAARCERCAVCKCQRDPYWSTDDEEEPPVPEPELVPVCPPAPASRRTTPGNSRSTSPKRVTIPPRRPGPRRWLPTARGV